MRKSILIDRSEILCVWSLNRQNGTSTAVENKKYGLDFDFSFGRIPPKSYHAQPRSGFSLKNSEPIALLFSSSCLRTYGGVVCATSASCRLQCETDIKWRFFFVIWCSLLGTAASLCMYHAPERTPRAFFVDQIPNSLADVTQQP